MNKTERERLGAILIRYQGSNEMLSDEDSDFLYAECPSAGREFDNEYFHCAHCWWWCEVHEHTENPEQDEAVCQDCDPYEEE